MSTKYRGWVKTPLNLFRRSQAFSKLSQSEAKERLAIITIYQIANHFRFKPFPLSNRFLAMRTGLSVGFCQKVITRLNRRSALLIKYKGDRDNPRIVFVIKPTKKFIKMPLHLNALKGQIKQFAIDLLLRSRKEFDGEFSLSSAMWAARFGVTSQTINVWVNKLDEQGYLTTLKRGNSGADRLIICSDGSLRDRLSRSVPQRPRRVDKPLPKEDQCKDDRSSLKRRIDFSKLAKARSRKQQREKHKRIDLSLYNLESLARLRDKFGLNRVTECLKKALKEKGLSDAALSISKLFLVKRHGEWIEVHHPTLNALPRISFHLFSSVLAKLLLERHEADSLEVIVF